MVLSFDPHARSAKLSLRQTEILKHLQEVCLSLCNNTPADPSALFRMLKKKNKLELLLFYRSTIPTFHPEYGRYMLESTPGAPYTGSLKDLMSVESNMRYR